MSQTTHDWEWWTYHLSTWWWLEDCLWLSFNHVILWSPFSFGKSLHIANLENHHLKKRQISTISAMFITFQLPFRLKTCARNGDAKLFTRNSSFGRVTQGIYNRLMDGLNLLFKIIGGWNPFLVMESPRNPSKKHANNGFGVVWKRERFPI